MNKIIYLCMVISIFSEEKKIESSSYDVELYQKYIKNRNYVNRSKELEKIILEAPDEIKRALASNERSSGNYGDAIILLQSISKYTEDSIIFLELGLIYLKNDATIHDEKKAIYWMESCVLFFQNKLTSDFKYSTRNQYAVLQSAYELSNIYLSRKDYFKALYYCDLILNNNDFEKDIILSPYGEYLSYNRFDCYYELQKESVLNILRNDEIFFINNYSLNNKIQKEDFTLMILAEYFYSKGDKDKSLYYAKTFLRQSHLEGYKNKMKTFIKEKLNSP